LIKFGSCTLDSSARTLACDGRSAHLSGKAFQLLLLLIEERPRVVPKEELFQRLWPDTFVSETNLAGLVKEIRAALGDDAREPRFIRTAHRVGYSFVGEVEESAPQNRPLDSVAVLRFTNLSGQPDCDYLAEGVADALINSLSSVGGIRVSPRMASFRFGDGDDFAELRRQLRVRAVVMGRVRLDGTSLSLQCELVDLDSNSQIWGAQLRGTIAELQSLQDDLSRRVVAQLHVRGSVRPPAAVNAEAYQSYLKGRHHWNRRTLEGIERGILYFQAAIDADPQFAAAHAGLADSYIALASRDLFPPAQLFPRAESAALKALELAPDLAEAHASIGAINELFRWNWAAAEKSFREALRLDPGYAIARTWYAQTLAHRGEFASAVEQLTLAMESDPISYHLNTHMATVHYLARDYAQAERYVRRSFEINPYHEPAHFTLGLALEQLGRYDEARAELERSHAITKGEPHAEAALGHLDKARDRLQRLHELAAGRHVSAVHFAVVHTALGEHDEALDWLRRAIESRSGWLVYLKTEPRFDPLRGMAGFAGVLGEIGFA
jgi:DNA-binding winged helix-turn-helix (wHTH) protein/tetratricopeptide (TPR) repeat protein